VLDVANGYAIDKNSKFRGQQVEIEILVPIGKKIRFDESVNDKLNSVNVRVKRGRRRNRVVDVEIDDRSSRFRSGVDYIMGINGKLKSEEGEIIEKKQDNEYRYPGTDSSSTKIEQRKIEETKKIFKTVELKETKKVEPVAAKTIAEPKNRNDELAGGPSVSSSLVQWF
jgi:hypothetical protein